MSIMTDGFATTIIFGSVSSGVTLSAILEEKSVTPPGLEAGGEIDVTSMRNTSYRTKAPKTLKNITNTSFTAAYDPDVYDEIKDNILGSNQQIELTFPDSSTISFYGWLNSFTPNENTEGEQPTAECVIIASSRDASGNEQSGGPTLA